jgi:hypothetical protein
MPDSTSTSTLINDLRNLVTEFLEELEALVSVDAPEDADEFEKPSMPAIVQATLRGNVLHIQEGQLSSYAKNDITVSDNERLAIARLLEGGGPSITTSLYGSNTPYVLGSRNGDVYEFEGFTFNKAA